MKLVPVNIELENNSTDERMRMTVEYEIVLDGFGRGYGFPFSLDHRIYELPEIPLVPLLEGVVE